LLTAQTGGASVIPFRLIADNVVIDVRVNGVAASAIFDTGGRNVMTPALARRLRLGGGGGASVGGVGAGKVGFAITRVRELRVGSVTLRDQPFLILPLPYELTSGGPAPVEVDLGAELLHRCAASLDFERNHLTLTPSAQFRPPAGSQALPLTFDDTTPSVTATLDGLSGTFLVDTGSSFEVALTAPFVAKHRLTERYPHAEIVAAGQGLGGETYARFVRAGVLTLGDQTLRGPVVQLSSDTAGALASAKYAGIIGIDALKRFAVSFDYTRRRMYLTPGPASGAQVPYDRTGMSVDRNDSRSYTVSAVWPKGPAAAAGLRDGDAIVDVDGVPASAVDTQRWWVLAHEPVGTVVRLTILRGAARSMHILTLRDVL